MRRRKGLLLITVAFVLWVVYAICSMDKTDDILPLSKDLDFIVGLHQFSQPEHPFGDWVSAHNRHFSDLVMVQENE